MNKEEIHIQNRFEELATISDLKGIVMFTDFLNLNEQHILNTTKSKFKNVEARAFGGYTLAERQMIAFIPDALCYEWNYPFTCLKIGNCHEKYAQKLSHRDYLGAILNLGIERGKIGDILCLDDGGYVFCHESLVRFLLDELRIIKHTAINIEETIYQEQAIVLPMEIIKGTVAAPRVDAVLSFVYKSSRTKLVDLIQGKKVYVNGKIIQSNSLLLKENDIVSVRGIGKFAVKTLGSTTKKGRIVIEINRYI